MTTLTLVITDAGQQAIVDEDNMGTLPVMLTEIGVGTGKWAPTTAATALQNELKRISAVGGLAVADDILHVTLTDASTDAYALGEFGIYTDSGVLFAIYSDLDGIADKASDGLLLIATDIILTSISPGEIAVGDAGFNNPPATETVAGVAELATQTEATAGADDTRIMTPLKAKTAAAAYTYTADQALPTPANTGTLAQMISWFAGLIKGITGKSDWKTAPATTLEAAAAHHASTANPHATTAAQVSAEPAFSAGIASQYRRGDKTWQDLATAARAVVLTGLSTATNAVITAADSILSALGKLQAQITAHSALTAPHSATSSATASRLMMRDASGRAKVSAPSEADDIARKDTVDAAQAAASIPSGTIMLFGQSSAPTGWTKLVDHNDKALRVVSGTVGYGGSVSFSAAMAGRSVTNTAVSGSIGATTLTTAQMPSHYHISSYGVNDTPRYGSTAGLANARIDNDAGPYYSTSGPHTSSAGGGATHNHTFTGDSHNHDLDMAVQYVDVIRAQKN